MKAKESESKFSSAELSFPKKGFLAAILVISVFAMFTVVASVDDPPCNCGDICVNETGWWPDGSDFNASDTPIPHAIDNATAGDTICVKDGTYTESVNRNKRLTIRSENGSASTIVNASNPNDHVFDVTANWVNISGFTVQNATYGAWPVYKAGLYLGNGVEHCNISDNNATNNYFGIWLNQSNNNANLNNYGIALHSSSNYNTLTSNTANYNQQHGLYAASDSTNNEINSNTFCNNNQSGGNYYDIYDADSNSGDNNTCDTTYNWNDTGTTGCSWTCPSGVETSTNAGTAYFSTTNGAITDLVNISESTLPPAEKPNLKFPYGFFSFNITGLSSGETIT